MELILKKIIDAILTLFKLCTSFFNNLKGQMHQQQLGYLNLGTT